MDVENYQLILEIKIHLSKNNALVFKECEWPRPRAWLGHETLMGIAALSHSLECCVILDISGYCVGARA